MNALLLLQHVRRQFAEPIVDEKLQLPGAIWVVLHADFAFNSLFWSVGVRQPMWMSPTIHAFHLYRCQIMLGASISNAPTVAWVLP